MIARRLKDERKGVEVKLKDVEAAEKQGAVEMNKCSMNVKRLVVRLGLFADSPISTDLSVAD